MSKDYKGPVTSRIAFGGPQEGILQKAGNFGLSMLESFPELFGIAPSLHTQAWRAKNPISGFISQALPTIIPYAGEAKLLEAIPATSKVLARVAEMGGQSAAKRLAFKTAAEVGATEATRLALSATPIPSAITSAVEGQNRPRTESLPSIAGSGLINILAGGALGAAGGAISSRLARGVRIPELAPGAGYDRPMLLRIRAIDQALARHMDPNDPLTLSQPNLDRLTNERGNLINLNLRGEKPFFTPSGEAVGSESFDFLGPKKPFRPLIGETKKDRVGAFLNKVANPFNNNPDKITKASILGYDANIGTTKEVIDNIEKVTGLTKEQIGANAQNISVIDIKGGTGKRAGAKAEVSLKDLGLGEPSAPTDTTTPANENVRGDRSVSPDAPRRVLSTEPAKPSGRLARDENINKAKLIERRLTRGPFKYAGDGWFMAEEQDGLAVMARKTKGDIKSPKPGDQWIVLRTDKPEAFTPQAELLNRELEDSAYFPRPKETARTGVPIYDAGAKYLETFGQNLPKMKQKFTQSALLSGLRESAYRAGSYVAPTQPLGTRNPKLNLALQYLNLTKDLVAGKVARHMHGDVVMGETPMKTALSLKAPRANNGADALVKALSKEDLKDFQSLAEANVPIGKVEQFYRDGVISPAVRDLFMYQQRYSDEFAENMAKYSRNLKTDSAQHLIADFQARQGHYALSHDFSGPYKAVIRDENHEIVGWGHGESPQAAREAAAQVIKDQGERGRSLHVGGMIDRELNTSEDFLRFRGNFGRPGFLKPRTGWLGDALSTGELSHSKLSEAIAKNITRREGLLRKVTIEDQLNEIMNDLKTESPADAIELQRRINFVSGDEGAFAKVQNQMLDKTLHLVGLPAHDSASAIVRNTKGILTEFQFNFGFVTQPLIHLMGTFQTVLPEASFVLHATDDQLARSYVSVPLVDAGNRVRGTMGILSEIKMLWNGLNHLMKPEPEFMTMVREMIDRRVLTPQYSEDQFGVNGEVLGSPLQAFKETGSFIKLLHSANSLLISKGEQLNRMIALGTSYELGTKVLGLSSDQLAHFMAENLGKTVFRYSLHDRPAVFTTPFGSLLGTFKTWLFHYMANMVNYAQGGRSTLPALFWQTASTAFFGGAAATPFLLPVANGFSSFFTGKDAEDQLYDGLGAEKHGVGERVADSLMYGLPGTLGLSLSSRMAAPGSDPARDAAMLFSFAAWDRVTSIGSTTKDALVEYQATGRSPWEDPRVRTELIRAFAPRSIYRAMAVSQDTAIRSLNTGNPIIGKIGLGGAALYAMGFNPTELDRTYDAYDKIRNNAQRKQDLQQHLGAAMADAIESGNTNLSTAIMTRAMALGIDTGSVLRSAQKRRQLRNQTMIQRSEKPERLAQESSFVPH